MKKRNLTFLDIETTGLNIQKHEIIEIGGVVVSQSWEPGQPPTFEVVEEFEFKVKPQRISDADPVSLRINGYDPSAWVFGFTLPEALRMVADKTKDSIMVAHNVAYDFSYLDKAFAETGVENTMHYHKLDTISIAFAKLRDVEDVSKFSLRFLCEYFGIDNKNAHTALSDARATFELYKKLMSL